jgi:NAD+ synthetase
MTKIYLAQCSPRIACPEINSEIILYHYNKANDSDCDICLFPELFLSGYIPHDLLLKKSFIHLVKKQADYLVSNTKNTTLLLPLPFLDNGYLYNSIIASNNGIISAITHKKHLPNYSIFDEKRYFKEGNPQIITLNNGVKIGVPICEDIWHSDVCRELKKMGAELFLVPNASPYNKGKFLERAAVAKARFDENNIPIIYCNQVLGHDGIVYDGMSFVYNEGITMVMKGFEEDIAIFDINPKPSIYHTIIQNHNIPISHIHSDRKIQENTEHKNQNILNSDKRMSKEEDSRNRLSEEICKAILLGTKDYTIRNKFSKIVLGISGGLDSALVAWIASKIINPKDVIGVTMPSKFNSQSSFDDAMSLIKNLGISHLNIPINNILEISTSELVKFYKNPEALSHQNLQARIRGMLLMNISNMENALLLTTGNKSENAVGYCTLYGDMCGGFNPIKDLYKTEVYNLARYINSYFNSPIPENIIFKAPSAELAFNQKDSDSLPEYEILDKILELYIDQNLSISEIVALNFARDLVEEIVKKVDNSEFKRHQSAIGVKVSSMSFEKDRRYPISS